MIIFLWNISIYLYVCICVHVCVWALCSAFENNDIIFSSVQFSSVAHPRLTLQPHGLQASLSITNSRSLLKLMSVESVMPSNHLILCCPLLLLPLIFSSIRFFSRLNLDKFQIKSRKILFTRPHMANFLNSRSYNDHSLKEI